MSSAALIGLSLGLPLIVMFAVTAIVSLAVRRAPATTAWKGARDGILFVVCLRKWQRVMIRTIGIVAIVLGAMIFLAAISLSPVPLDMGIAGAATVVGGLLFVLLAHGMGRLRLEVAEHTIWAFPLAGKPKQVAVSEIKKLAPLRSSNFGGLDARSDHRRLFYATTVMLGYTQLLDFLRTKRPDLFSADHPRSVV